MNKTVRLIAIFIIAVLIPTAVAAAFYSTLSGELRDSKTGALWTHGADVEVFNCNDYSTIVTTTVDFSGQFTVSLPIITTTTGLCVNVSFYYGGTGTPGDAAKGPYPDRSGYSGNLDTGVYFTGTGPTAITLKSLDARSEDSSPALWIGSLLILVITLGIIALRRRRFGASA